MKSISRYISDTLAENKIIKPEDADTCRYGIDYFIISVLEILSVLIVSAFVGNFMYTLIFFASFIALRFYAGGYHADTKIGCYAILWGVYVLFTLILNNYPAILIEVTEIIILLITFTIVLICAPVINEKKSVNQNEIKFYRKASLVSLFAETIIIIVGIFSLADNKYIFAFSIGQLAVSLSMVAAFVKSYLKRRCTR